MELFFADPSAAGHAPTTRRWSHPDVVTQSLDKPTPRTQVAGRPADAPEAGWRVRP